MGTWSSGSGPQVLCRCPGFHTLPPPVGAHSEEKMGQGIPWHSFWQSAYGRRWGTKSGAPLQHLWDCFAEPWRSMVKHISSNHLKQWSSSAVREHLGTHWSRVLKTLHVELILLHFGTNPGEEDILDFCLNLNSKGHLNFAISTSNICMVPFAENLTARNCSICCYNWYFLLFV